MSIAADYGGDRRHYDAVKFADGSSRQTVNHRHDTERCQFFNSMVYSCLFHDRASLDLSLPGLDAARLKGLWLTLCSGKQDYETIDLPANISRGSFRLFSESLYPSPSIGQTIRPKQPRIQILKPNFFNLMYTSRNVCLFRQLF